MTDKNEFYIGWMTQAPDGFAKQVKKALIGIFLLLVAVGVIIAMQQRRFSTATFEFGKTTTITGVYQSSPVPSLRITTRPDAFGKNAVLTIPLVGYGKHGAAGIIASIEKQAGLSLERREVSLKGSLIYSDGKTLLQIDGHDQPLVEAGSIKKVAAEVKELGNVELTGEILDPKCYFGVMKPGQGKPHKDCAVRCIAGGISPVFYVRNEAGEADYYLVLDDEGKPMNKKLKDLIADPVSLRARAVQYDDWVVLYVSDPGTIHRTGGLSWFKTKDGDISCTPSSVGH